MASIELSDVRVVLGTEVVLAGVDLTVAPGEAMVVVGASGSGKTTLLRVVAGLQRVTAGRVVVDGIDVTDHPPGGRDLGMVAQGAPLQPTTTVEGNVLFPLRIRGGDPAERQQRVDAELRAFGLGWLRRRRPATLSAGQRQSAATARAMVRLPSTVLLDEPVNKLDARTRAEALGEIRSVQRGSGATLLVTTNDLTTARAIGDRVAVLVDGRVAQVGPLDDVVARPALLAVADLVWTSPPARLAATATPRPGRATLLSTAAGDLTTWAPAAVGDLLVAPDPAHLALTDGREGLRGRIVRVVPLGHATLALVDTDAGRLEVRASGAHTLATGDRVGVRVGRALVTTRDGVPVAMLDR